MNRFAIFLLACLGFFSAPLLAQTPPPAGATSPDLIYTPPVPPTPFSVTNLLLKLVGMTVFLLLICAALILWAKRSQRTGKPGMKDGQLTYVATLHLDHKNQLHLLDAEGLPILVGTDLVGIKAVTPLNEE
ncbi:MAG: hypothetical protein N2112_13165 [Gemmataceae bacterium]|nr:hypothetical protein [Gemmataceae bacterium]